MIAPAGSEVPEKVTLFSVPLRPLGRFLAVAASEAIRQAKRHRPQWVLAGSGLTAPLAWLAARASGARAAAYVHGLDLVVRHPVYRALWLPAIRRLDRVIANSRATAALAQEIGVTDAQLAVVPPGVGLPVWEESERLRRRQAFRAEYGLGERPLLLTVGRLTTRKGVLPFVRDVLPRIVALRPDVVLVIVGDTPKHALAAQAEPPEQIMAAARTAGVFDHVVWVGPKFGSQLSAAYAAADVHVFPVREIPGDPEGFGMVAIEAAAHGLTTVAYATGGVIEAVAEGISGRLVPPADSEAFAWAVLQALTNPLPRAPMLAWAQRHAWPRFGERIGEALSRSSR